MPASLIPLRHFFDNPEKALGTVSPDGRYIAYLAPDGGKLNVWVRTRGKSDDRALTHDHVRPIQGYSWSRDSRFILYPQDQGGDENYHVLRVDVTQPGSEPVDLTPFPGARAMIVAEPPATPGKALVMVNNRDAAAFDLHRLDLATGEMELVVENPGRFASFAHDAKGRVVAASASNAEGKHEVYVRADETEDFRLLATFDTEDEADLHGVDADGANVLVGTAWESDCKRLVSINAATAEFTILDANEGSDLLATMEDRNDHHLQMTAYLKDRLELHFFDERIEKIYAGIRRIHPGDPYITSHTDDWRLVVVNFNDDRDAGITFVYDTESEDSELLFRPRPWMHPEELAPMTPVRIQSRDGLSLPCYLTLPVGLEPAGLPMVLLVHGGPWARDAWTLQPEVQFLANRGYAVLQVNYRGSTGFGKSFTHAAEKEFAGKMHDDLIDAVNWAVEKGYADPARIGIYGGSYGGYATLVGVTFTPDVFAAAIDYVGPSSLETLIRSFPAYWRPFMESTWFRYVGDPDVPEDREDMLKRSPLNYIDRIKTPLMVFQGANDPRVTKLESDQLVEALQKRGVKVRYIVKDDEGHGFVNPENRLEIYSAMEEFFAELLGGRVHQPELVR
ncbi:MAG: alpha/beta fold hydrolase [Candidatus Dormibacteria bacterium]